MAILPRCGTCHIGSPRGHTTYTAKRWVFDLTENGHMVYWWHQGSPFNTVGNLHFCNSAIANDSQGKLIKAARIDRKLILASLAFFVTNLEGKVFCEHILHSEMSCWSHRSAEHLPCPKITPITASDKSFCIYSIWWRYLIRDVFIYKMQICLSLCMYKCVLA